MTIRLLGGLLGAYDLSGDARLLRLATAAGDQLLGAFNPDGTGLPAAQLNMRTGARVRQHPWARGVILAEVGSVQLELTRLLQLTRRPIGSPLSVAANSLHEIINMHTSPNGLVPHFIASSGRSQGGSYHVNGGCDSYYEYLLKLWLLTGRRDTALLKAYTAAVTGINTHLVYRSSDNHTFLGSITTPPGVFTPQMEHLACFASGMLALGALRDAANLGSHGALAAELGETCWRLYADSPTGLAPDRIVFSRGQNQQRSRRRTNRAPAPTPGYSVVDDKYSLRPETVESFFYLWRLTKHDVWRQRGWAIFEALQKHCRTPAAFAGLSGHAKEDSMPSFWLAETLKYLFLLFSLRHDVRRRRVRDEHGGAPAAHRHGQRVPEVCELSLVSERDRAARDSEVVTGFAFCWRQPSRP